MLVFECVVFWRNFTYYSAGKIFTLLLAVTNITPVREIERNWWKSRRNSCGQANGSTEGNTRGPRGPKKEGKPFHETENMVNFWLDAIVNQQMFIWKILQELHLPKFNCYRYNGVLNVNFKVDLVNILVEISMKRPSTDTKSMPNTGKEWSKMFWQE